jgi:hypothetical protein
MLVKREWATPIVMGAFTLSGLTGVAMLIGWKSQTTLTLHQWLGLTFVIGGLAHITVNFPSYKRHLKQRLGLVIVSVYVALAIAAFLPLAPARPTNNPLTTVINSLQQAPLKDMAQIFKTDPQTLVERLRAAGFQVGSSEQSIADVAGPDFKQRMRAMGALAGGNAMRHPGARHGAASS